MELRHLRYFVAVAEEHSFAHAARRLRVAQPALSKQVRDVETELGVTLFDRLPRGVRLTPAGEAFLAEARSTLEAAGRAVTSARSAAKKGASDLEFAHGELGAYTRIIEDLLAAFRASHPEARLRVSSMSDADIHQALRERQVDVASVFVAQWPVAGFDALRLVDCAVKGVLLPASHPLAAGGPVRLQDLPPLPWLHSSLQRWPGFFRTLEEALQDRGLVPLRRRERPKETPSANVQIAAGEAWTLASEAIAAPYRTTSPAIVYRPFVEPPIPCWIALVWRTRPPQLVHDLVAVARALPGAMDDADHAAYERA
jgi:DNA-binding transcriptional LysR family regulator